MNRAFLNEYKCTPYDIKDENGLTYNLIGYCKRNVQEAVFQYFNYWDTDCKESIKIFTQGTTDADRCRMNADRKFYVHTIGPRTDADSPNDTDDKKFELSFDFSEDELAFLKRSTYDDYADKLFEYLRTGINGAKKYSFDQAVKIERGLFSIFEKVSPGEFFANPSPYSSSVEAYLKS